MGKEKRVLRVLALSLTGIFLLLLLWGLSPGPEWLARFAAERYAKRYACDYSCHALVIEGEISRRVAGTFQVRYPSWIVLLSREDDPDRQGTVLRLELKDGIFPTAVTEASWWTPEESMERPEIPLPVSP